MAAALQLRFSVTGRTADLEMAIATTREAVSLLSEDQPGLPLHLSNLGNGLRMRYEAAGRLADLEEAISAARRAVQATAPGHCARGRRLSNLGYALRLRFERTGRLRDVDEAIEVGGRALMLTPDDDPSGARLQSNLGIALRERYEHAGDPVDLGAATDLAMQAVARTPPDHPDRAGMMSNLALALYQQYESGRAEDLGHAITAARAALALTPGDHPDRAMYALNLAVLFRAQAAASNDGTYLDEAIGSARYAVTLLPEKHPDRAASLSLWVAPSACGTASCTTPETPARPPTRAARRPQSQLPHRQSGHSLPARRENGRWKTKTPRRPATDTQPLSACWPRWPGTGWNAASGKAIWPSGAAWLRTRPPALCTFHRSMPSNSSSKDARCYGPSDFTTGLTFAASTRPFLPSQTGSARSEPNSIMGRRSEIPKTAGESCGTIGKTAVILCGFDNLIWTQT